tara:strand:- start:332 stop:718 length:387 start_codon:yes stop_codon:yes gene_type:complete
VRLPVIWVIVAVAVGGIGVGAGTSALLIQKKPPPAAPVGVGQIELSKQLTDLDLLKEPCDPKYVTANGDGLCREMFCRMQARGIDAGAEGSECESISNLNNSATILQVCGDPTSDTFDECLDVFRTRK